MAVLSEFVAQERSITERGDNLQMQYKKKKKKLNSVGTWRNGEMGLQEAVYRQALMISHMSFTEAKSIPLC